METPLGGASVGAAAQVVTMPEKDHLELAYIVSEAKAFRPSTMGTLGSSPCSHRPPGKREMRGAAEYLHRVASDLEEPIQGYPPLRAEFSYEYSQLLPVRADLSLRQARFMQHVDPDYYRRNFHIPEVMVQLVMS
ncbi:hypothetical protein OsJ_29041 [Oryza sativa Japonica Group]|uniref:Uncharacterized protein n=1 Tax=Oryza sativa subsp. japonica TaxID=39947 RepID=A3BXY7_ORYSJ|nr:hypothetical protein OsJ_29041 [Oryza sativa Japonica Group]